MSDKLNGGVRITLSPVQVQDVLRAASSSGTPALGALVSGGLVSGALSAQAVSAGESDPCLSRSLLRGLLILTRFQATGAERGIVEIAKELGMSASTAHRYAQTLVRVGLLERCPTTRKYRRPDC